MKLRRSRLAMLASIGLVGSMLVVPAMTDVARAATQTVAIAVDHGPPIGHNFEYVDFFPRAGVKIHRGDVVDFGWAHTPDGLHTATLLKTGESPGHAWATKHARRARSRRRRIATPDQPGRPESDTCPPAGSGAPGACGSAATACVYDGSADLNSGANPTTGSAHFFVKVNVPAGTTVNVVCLVHPGMAGSFDVVGAGTPTSTPTEVAAAAAAAQAASDDRGAFAAEKASSTPQVANNADGTHTVTLIAGTATNFVEVAEMLPATATVTAGRHRAMGHQDDQGPPHGHLPHGPDPSTEPIPAVLRGHARRAANRPPAGPPCGDPSKFEIHLNPAPVGPTAIATPVTVASSGLIGTPPAPFPTSYSFTFPNAGTFTYQCRIHDHMFGHPDRSGRGGHADHDHAQLDRIIHREATRSRTHAARRARPAVALSLAATITLTGCGGSHAPSKHTPAATQPRPRPDAVDARRRPPRPCPPT